MSHSLITIAVLVLSYLLTGNPLYGGLLTIGYWSGREFAQAESRHMKLHKTNRDNSPWYRGFLPNAWNFDGLVVDMLIPNTIALLTIGVFYLWVI